MDQVVENFSNLSLLQSYSGDIANFILSICSKYGVDASTATPYIIVILGCVFLLIYGLNKRPRKKPRSLDRTTSSCGPKPKSADRTRSWIIREIHSGKTVLDRLVEDFNKARVNPATLAITEDFLKALLQEEHLDLMKLQQMVAKLEMSGSEDSAVKILEEAVKKANEANKPHEAYEIEMLLVEMFIYKGQRDLEKVLNCKCLKDESLKDARRPLYKAIIYQMKGNTEKAKECWEEFVEIQEPPLEGISRSRLDFDLFKKSVDQLQSAIEEIAGTRG
ncbi:putative transmembrane protein [Sesbania bispinosa]|nr:putative transmembrane protein [Sesbania bispinosa]